MAINELLSPIPDLMSIVEVAREAISQAGRQQRQRWSMLGLTPSSLGISVTVSIRDPSPGVRRLLE